MKKEGMMIRSLLVCLGIVGTIWFIIPLFRSGSINIGTITGVGVFGALILYGIMLDKANKGVVSLWNNI